MDYAYIDYGLLVADWAQTRQISRACPAKYVETNPILGNCPSKGKVDTYFAGSIAAVKVLSDSLDQPYRNAFLIGVGLLEVAVVKHNLELNIQVKF